jgi:hypothetical protein
VKEFSSERLLCEREGQMKRSNKYFGHDEMTLSEAILWSAGANDLQLPRFLSPALGRRLILLCALIVAAFALSSLGASQSAPGKAAQASNKAPTVVTSPDGQHSIQFTAAQQSAISLFLQTHPGMQAANCQTLGYAPADCAGAYTDWAALVHDAKAELQYPYAAWGDFNHDGQIDFVVPFFGHAPVNSWGWHQWSLVVFQGMSDGHFTPVIAATDKWGTCFDGMLFHPVRKQIEYWCKSAGGSFRWNGSKYVAKRLVGD